MEKIVDDFSIICRVCLKNNQNTKQFYIFSNYNDKFNIAPTLMECASLQINKDDGLPQNICYGCLGKLDDYFDFRKLCIVSDNYLWRQIKSENLEIKLEFHVPESFKSSDLNKNVKEQLNKVSKKLTKTKVRLKNSFPCPNCGKVYSRKDRLRQHLTKCELIIKKEPNDVEIKQEPEEITNKNFVINSKETNQYRLSYKNGNNLEKPKKKVKYTYQFPCNQCGKIFSRGDYLRQHMPNCDPIAQENIKNDFFNSIKPNSDTGLFECEQCKKNFLIKYNLKRHMYAKHNFNYLYMTRISERNFPCNQCRTVLTSSDRLERHKNKAHNTQRQKCDVCNKTFKTRRILIMHRRAIHEGLIKYTCEFCGKIFKDGSTFRYHKKAIHLNVKNYKCETCQRSFVDNAHLKLHQQSHLSREDRQLFKCEVCNKTFTTKKTLKYHRSIHTGERPHVCEYCEKSFRLKKSLKKHMKGLHSDSWEKEWIYSEHPGKEFGKFVLSSGKFFNDPEEDKGLQTSQDARFYAVSRKFEPFSNKDKELVIQFSVKHEQNIDCGGGYVKVFDCKLEPKDMHGDTPYEIMFGPDICGPGTKKVHVIFSYKGKNHLINKDIKCKDDVFTHAYTLIVRPDNTYEVQIDGEKVESGELEADWDFLPPKKIKDPSAKKPEDWDDRPTIADPDDKKPEDWDKPEHIPDPDAQKPEDWDDEMDGEWEAPMIDNPEFKGEWAPKQIDNPAYKGPWVHPEIDNPEYKPDPELYKRDEICAIGFDLWQVKSGTIFDNVLITTDVANAKQHLVSIKKRQEGEKKMKEELDKKEAEALAKEGKDADDDDDDDDDKKSEGEHDEL